MLWGRAPSRCSLNHSPRACVQVLLDFLRLVRRRKLAETQRVGAQLAGAEADLQEAKRRLAAVHISTAYPPLHAPQPQRSDRCA